jgi:membrane protease YdiL (CAAX protease family)
VTNDLNSRPSAPSVSPIISNEPFVPLSGTSQLDPDNPPWTALQAFLTWLLSVALLFLPQLLALPYVAVQYQGARPTLEMLLADRTFILIIVTGILPAHLLTLGVAWAVVTRWGRFSPAAALGWSWPQNFRLWQSVGFATLLFMLAMFIIYKFGGQETDLERILQSSRAAALVTAFIAVTTAPLVEEIIYRGLLYSALQRLFGQLLAVVVVAAAFAGLHVLQYWPNMGAIGSIALLSVVLTVVRARTRSLLPSFAIHATFNGIQSFIIVVEPYLKTLVDIWGRKTPTGSIEIFLTFLR